MRRLLASFIAILTVTGVLTACTPPEDPPAPSFTALEASVDGETQPEITPAELSDAAVAQIDALGSLGAFVVGAPVDIYLDGEMPGGGAVLTKSYAAPIPDDAAATFVYWDEEFEAWTAVPTTLSEDRRTITATVDHFSLWTDFVAGSQAAVGDFVDGAKQAGQAAVQWAGQKIQESGEFLHWSAGNLFSTRVELPECDLSTPDWVSDLPVRTDVDDPVRFCAGHDANNPDLLVVKARSNRGYGFPVELSVDPAWEYNSSSPNMDLGYAIGVVAELDKTIGQSVGSLLNSGRFVAAGQEISFGIEPSALRDYSSEYLIELPAPSVGQFVATLLAEQVTKWGLSQADGILAGTVAAASCWSELSQATNPGQGAAATLECLTPAKLQVAQMLGEVLLAGGLDPVSAGRIAGTAVRHITVALALLPAVIATTDYIAEVNESREKRALGITLNEDALNAVPGFPMNLQGEWCSQGTTPQECFSLSEQASKYPDLALRDSSNAPAAPGTTDYAICLQLDLRDSCTTASTIYLRYFPEGVEWDCSTMNGFPKTCASPDYSKDHDTSKSRLVLLFNHQQDAQYHDSPPMYES